MARLGVIVVALLIALAVTGAQAACVPPADRAGRWECSGTPEEDAAAVIAALGRDGIACLGGRDAVALLAETPHLAPYYDRFLGRVSEAQRAAVLRMAAVADAADAPEILLWWNALYALHAAFPRQVLLHRACLPLVAYAGGRLELPAGVAGVPPVADEPTAAAAAERLQPRRVPAAPGVLDARNATSRCNATEQLVECERNAGDVFIGLAPRSFLWQTPLGTVPPGGWPAAIHYHGSFGAPHVFSWRAGKNYPFGLYWQGLTIKELLDRGYAVITPESHFHGFLFWDTNLPVWRTYWERSMDHDFVVWLLDEMTNSTGVFGALNATRFYATGLSSGAYMTSRMAVNYNGVFRALAIHSGSYANCAGPICAVPELPADHPPTLFAHGEEDLIVGIRTMELYTEQMARQGLTYKTVINPTAGHEWIPEAVTEIPDWFDLHA